MQESTQITIIVAGMREVLGEDLVGAYLHGSGVLGGFRPHSDIDLLVVSKRRTAEEERLASSTSFCLFRKGRRAQTGRPVELDIVVESEIRPWRYPPPFDFHYSEGWRDRFEGGDLEPWTTGTNPSTASAITMALLGGEPLAGPPAAQVFDPVPRSDYVEAILRDTETVDEFLPWDTRNVVLTLLAHLECGGDRRGVLKEEAGLWALLRLPAEHRPVLDLAPRGVPRRAR